MRGNILTANSKQSFKDTFGVTRDDEEYGGTLAFTILSLVNQVIDVFGDAQAIITIHKNCKLMLLPMPSYEILVGLVFIVQLTQKTVRSPKTLKHHCKPPAEH